MMINKEEREEIKELIREVIREELKLTLVVDNSNKPKVSEDITFGIHNNSYSLEEDFNFKDNIEHEDNLIVYTGYFAKANKYKEAGLTPISIASKTPGKAYMERWDFLVPSNNLFNKWKYEGMDNETFEKCYIEENLSRLDKEEFKELLKSTDNPILLCYEGPNSFCHRHIVAEYITKELGIPTEEYII